MPSRIFFLALAVLVNLVAATARADTLSDVRDRGVLRCGVNGSVPGLSYRSEAGVWTGLDVDFCRAVAAAVLGDPAKVEFVALGNAERLDALAQGRIDLLSRNTTWTLSRDLGHGMTFVGVIYHDGQTFVVPRDDQVHSVLDLNGKRLCLIKDTAGPENARRYFSRHRMAFELLIFDDLVRAGEAYLERQCDALGADESQLRAWRASLTEPRAHRVLPELISKEPLGPAVRKGDPAWMDIVRWTLFTLIDAEELGIDSANVEQAKERAASEEVRLLLDTAGRSAALLGLEPGWSVRAIRAVGNYAELFERNLGSQSPLKLKRGYNALWRDGGLLYAPPVR